MFGLDFPSERTVNLQWIANANVSAFHTAWCYAHYSDRMLQCSDELRIASAELCHLVAEFPKVSPAHFWDQLFTLSAAEANSASLAERLCGRLGLTTSVYQSRLAATLKRCRHQFESAYPNYATDMPLRTGPLRQMWDGNGAGLLRLIGLASGEPLLVEEAQVVLVQPILGGMGYPHLSTNRIHLEALLTHAAPQLPESLRIAWLLSQLDLDRPVYSELINAHRLRGVAGLGMLPVVLTAGQELDLCHYSPQLVTEAIELWYADTCQLDAPTASTIVSTWWETFQASRPSWRIALAGLDQMLQ